MKTAPVRTSLLALGAFGLAVPAPAGAAAVKEDARVAVLVSQDAAPYQEALDGFRDYLEQQGVHLPIDVQSLHGDATAAGAALQRSRQDRASLVLTLGSLGTQAAVREVRDLPIVAGLVLNADDVAKAPNATAVVLEFPGDTQPRCLQRLLRGQPDVGARYNP